jgi:hypothetical protein
VSGYRADDSVHGCAELRDSPGERRGLPPDVMLDQVETGGIVM